MMIIILLPFPFLIGRTTKSPEAARAWKAQSFKTAVVTGAHCLSAIRFRHQSSCLRAGNSFFLVTTHLNCAECWNRCAVVRATSLKELYDGYTDIAFVGCA